MPCTGHLMPSETLSLLGKIAPLRLPATHAFHFPSESRLDKLRVDPPTSYVLGLSSFLSHVNQDLWKISRADLFLWHTSWSLGSALFLASWAAMMGPWAYATHLMSTPRLPFTAAYFGSIALTLYFSLGVSMLIIWHQTSCWFQLTCSFTGKFWLWYSLSFN